MKINCRNCNAELWVRKCACGRSYILTSAHTLMKRRDHTAKPIGESEAEKIEEKTCDLCKAKAEGEKPFKLVNIEMRQRTCPKCHTETLSYYEL
jgi:hypothetical protein